MSYVQPVDKASGGTITSYDWNQYVGSNFENHEARLGTIGRGLVEFGITTFDDNQGTYTAGSGWNTVTGTVSVDNTYGTFLGGVGPSLGTAGTTYLWEVQGWFDWTGSYSSSVQNLNVGVEYRFGFDDTWNSWQSGWMGMEKPDYDGNYPKGVGVTGEISRQRTVVRGIGHVTGTNDCALEVRYTHGSNDDYVIIGGTLYWTLWSRWNT